MSAPSARPLDKVLALDTSTEHLGVALGSHASGALWTHQGAGGAQASTTLIPVIQGLLRDAGWRLDELDAIAFGAGPGAFTGLRTACAVVQGLAVAARPGGIAVLPASTLLVVAEEARLQCAEQGMSVPERIVTLLDARMDEIYVAEVAVEPAGLRPIGPPWLSTPEGLRLGDGWPESGERPAPLLAGNAMAVYGERLAPAWRACPQVPVWPTARALWRLAPALWAQGLAVDAAGAQPLYVRDKVAQTTEERERARATKAAQATREAQP